MKEVDSREIVSEILYDEFDSYVLLNAVDYLDIMRQNLAGNGFEPPKVRDDLLELHKMVMGSTNHSRHTLEELTGQLDEVESVIYEINEQADKLIAIFMKLNDALGKAWDKVEELEGEDED